ncbi:hypothetical protein HT661_05440 [Halomonas titanicae]|uniref:hypothetical protein n=1 Tax=Vreelandella titanicae TaxID=664683 RepID=UPI0017E55BF2|nr:hypothetical protein [Halomonas titanicae]
MVIDDIQQGKLVSTYITEALAPPCNWSPPRWLAEPDDWAAVNNQHSVRDVTQQIRCQWQDEESGLD